MGQRVAPVVDGVLGDGQVRVDDTNPRARPDSAPSSARCEAKAIGER
jgi:hypothetical protein